MERYNRFRSGDRTVEITDEHFEKLCDALKELARCFDRGESIQKPLEDIMAVGFSVTGPGNYLREKGELKL
jgi:hypothetical protein